MVFVVLYENRASGSGACHNLFVPFTASRLLCGLEQATTVMLTRPNLCTYMQQTHRGI